VTAGSNCRNTALVFCVLACLFLLSTTSVHPQSKNNDPNTTKVVLRILNGKTGWPIWAELPNVWLGGANSPIDPPPRTDLRGEIKLEVPVVDLCELRFLPNWYADCRSFGDQIVGGKLKYSVVEILANGIVAENVCGKKRAKPTPGVLILYVRPRTWQEIIAL
jgi:hypothetical protein